MKNFAGRNSYREHDYLGYIDINIDLLNQTTAPMKKRIVPVVVDDALGKRDSHT